MVVMKDEKSEFSVLSEIFSQFTEENKDNLLKTAKQLLETQQGDAEMLTNTLLSSENQKERLEQKAVLVSMGALPLL